MRTIRNRSFLTLMIRPLQAALAGGVLLAAGAAQAQPVVFGERAALVDPLTNTLMFVKNGTPTAAAPASTTKVMTTYLALKAVKEGFLSLNDTVVISQKAATQPCNCFPHGAKTLIGGESMSLRDALYSIAMSHGETTVAVAEIVANAILNGNISTGSTFAQSAALEQDFVDMMNDEADALGMTNTTWKNVHGGDETGHVSTPRDLIKIWNATVDLDMDYLDYAGSRSRTVTLTTAAGTQTPVLARSFNYYPNIDGDKTGNSGMAPTALVAQSTRLERTLVASSLQTPSTPAGQVASGDVASMLAFGFRTIFNPERMVTAAAPTGTATVSSLAMDCNGREAVTAEVTQTGGLVLARWTDSFLDPGDFPVLRLHAASDLTSATDASVAHVSAGVAVSAAAVQEAGISQIYLSTWDVDGGVIGDPPEEVDVVHVGAGTNPRVVLVKSGQIAVSYIRTDGRLQIELYTTSSVPVPLGTVRAYEVNVASYTSPVGDTFTEASPAASRLNLCMMPGCTPLYGLLIAGRRANGNLRAISFLADDSSITRHSTIEGETATQVEATRLGLDHFATSIRTSGGDVKLIYWDMSTAGTLTRIDDTGNSLEAASETSIARLGSSSYDRPRLGALTATRNGSGRLKLIAWERDELQAVATEADYRIADSGVSGDLGSQMSVCRLADLSGGSSGAGDFVVAMRDTSSVPKVISWRVGAP
ncbi:uncharacterized protein SOCE26_100840 [Sorangium cellulosum]|uniref:Peptidase S11 D-alanyl-D-alanine carboxypeptidase A N-terminal domain-containing protein n=1 Tax=Sorangium cellulosum TaxID=56 RepID=A0A2L0FAC3_SORCE|nr:D-alanyl-D-alanine carboxypeptidase [Sorangium cellulosum]AUX48546.1 uncharacterized protein SOCE26_100840 [Sorangium cellulosum]